MRKTPRGGTGGIRTESALNIVKLGERRGEEREKERESLRKMVTMTTRMADAGFDMLW